MIYSAVSKRRRVIRLRAATSVDYDALDDLRYHIRRAEIAARATGVEPQQYLVLLQLKTLHGRRAPTIVVIAERLVARRYGVIFGSLIR